MMNDNPIGRRNRAPPRPSRARACRRSLVTLYDAWGKPQQADQYRALLPPEQETMATD